MEPATKNAKEPLSSTGTSSNRPAMSPDMYPANSFASGITLARASSSSPGPPGISPLRATVAEVVPDNSYLAFCCEKSRCSMRHSPVSSSTDTTLKELRNNRDTCVAPAATRMHG